MRTGKKCKGEIEISFSWLFAIVVGIVVIFGAIYFSSKIISTGSKSTNVQTGKELQILLNPLETSFQSSQTTAISIPSETRINNKCEESGPFGRQGLMIDQKSFNKWSGEGTSVWTNNRYIFSKEILEGKKFYIFSKPFIFPFKVSDIIYLTSENEQYCFKNAPKEVAEDIYSLKQDNLFLDNCPSGSIEVCFDQKKCDINVDYSRGYVEKDNDFLYFNGLYEDSTALMYAAIFSEKEVYECQIQRLVMRLKELSKLYIQKENFLIEEGCEADMNLLLEDIENLEVQNSEDFYLLKDDINHIYEVNNLRICKLW